jgi:TRAP-type mannitol/chloroaromatic compound transport system permease small subunit
MKTELRILRIFDAIGDWSGKIAAPLVGIITVVLIFEMSLRYAFNTPTVWVHETTQYLFATYAFVAGAYTFRIGMHVNMDILYRKIPDRTKAAVDLVTSLVALGYIISLLWWGGMDALDSIRDREVSTTVWAPPIYPFKAMLAIGAFLVLLQWLAKFIRDLMTVIWKGAKG